MPYAALLTFAATATVLVSTDRKLRRVEAQPPQENKRASG